MLDVTGFDATAPSVIADFTRGWEESESLTADAILARVVAQDPDPED